MNSCLFFMPYDARFISRGNRCGACFAAEAEHKARMLHIMRYDSEKFRTVDLMMITFTLCVAQTFCEQDSN